MKPLTILILTPPQPTPKKYTTSHTYTTYFSTTYHIPLLVTYTLHARMVACDDTDKTGRTDRFCPAPLLPDDTRLQPSYTGSHYDRGHNMPAADNACDSSDMDECFCFSNRTPQPHPFNNGRWKELERTERGWAQQYDSIIVSVGSLDPGYHRIGPARVGVPRYIFKVIYRPADASYRCYVFPNSAAATKPVESYRMQLKGFSKNSGISFSNGRPALPSCAMRWIPKEASPAQAKYIGGSCLRRARVA